MEQAEIEERKTWEEELYWKHFHEMHFYKILPNDFFHHLVLPSKFAKKMLDKVPKKLSLIGPSNSSWDVDISTTGDIAIVGDGWKDFAKTFNLEENYLLKFKYTQNLNLEVLIFDQKNRCEKEYSYFVKKCLPNPNNNVDREGSVDEAAKTEILILEDDDIDGSGSDCVMSKKPEIMCSAPDDDQGENNIVEAPITTLAEFDLSGKTKADGIQVVGSEGRSNEADENIVEAPITTLAEFDLSGKTKADGIQVVGSEGRSNEADENIVEAPITTLVEFDLSGKTKADGIEVVGSEGRSNEADENIVEAPITTLAEFDLSGKTKADGIEVVGSEGRSNEADENIVEAPITTLAEFDLSGKTKADAIEIVSSEETSNKADVADDTLDTQRSILVVGLVSTNSKGQLAKKPSNKATRSWALSQHNVIQQTPTGNGENKMHDALSAETLNGNGTPGTICLRNVIPKKRRSERAIPRSGKKLAFKIDTQRLSKEYMSQRRVVTDEEKEAALKRATEALTEGSFLVVMRPTSVYTNFYLSIPGDWINKNLPSRHHHQVILRIGEKTWMGMFHNNRRRGHSDGFATGWKNFTIENNLEDSDVCVFTPASQKGDAGLVLDVKIFRVVPEITPLTPLLCSIV